MGLKVKSLFCLRNWPLRVRLGLGFGVGAVLVVGVVAVVLYGVVSGIIWEGFRERLLVGAKLAAGHLNGDIHARIQEPKDMGGEDYKRILKVLKKIRNAGGGEFRYVYTMRVNKEGKLIFIVDGDEEDPCGVGEVYNEADEWFDRAVRYADKADVARSIEEDQWGRFLTAVVPIYTSDGRRDGIVGIDVDVTTILAKQKDFLLTELWVIGGLSLAMGWFGWLLGGSLGRDAILLNEKLKKEVEERKRVGRQLSLVEEIVENSEVVLFRWKVKGFERGLDYVTGNVGRWGYGRWEFLEGKKKFEDIVCEEDRERFETWFWEGVESENVEVKEDYRIVMKGGEELWVEVRMFYDRDASGDVTYVQGVLSDVTVLRERGLRFEEGMEFLQLLMDTIPNAIFYKDLEGIYRGCNEAYCEFLGKKKEEIVGHTVFDVFPRKYAEVYWDSDVELLKRGGKQVYEADMLNARGEVRSAILYKATYASEDGGVMGLIGTFADVTDLKKAQQELKDTNERLGKAVEKANQHAVEAMMAGQAKAEFLAMMSHEIRTPVSGLVGLSDLLLEEELGDVAKDHALGIKESSEVLLELVNDVLDISKIEAGKLEFVDEVFEVREVVRGAVNLLRVRMEKKGLKLKKRFDERVPKYVRGDGMRVKQVLLNFLGNAVKFTDYGEICIELVLLEEVSGDVVLRFAVEDTGIGLTESEKGKLFVDYMQADVMVERRYGGTGLGLAISKKIVDAMGGRIGVESKKGQGSTFWFHVKFGRVTEEEKVVFERKWIDVGEGEKRRLKVLLVEDNAVNQLVTVRVLEKLGHGVVVASGGEEALKLLQGSEHVDVVLMDLQMPGMDGLEVTKRIRLLDSEVSKIKVVALTANAFDEDRKRCFDGGMDGYLSKPVRKELLELELRRVMDA